MSLRGPMTCQCCQSKESTSGCVRGFSCDCTWDFCRSCHRCKKHCGCAWKVTVLFDGSLVLKVDYEGKDFEEVEKRIGHLAMIQVIDRIIVYKNGEQHRRIELK